MPEFAVQRATTPLPHNVNGKRILVAEDNIVNQKLAMTLLSNLGYAADLAENGADALKLLQRSHYDAILMDINMPVMDGIAATCAIREMEGEIGRIPIIALTAGAIPASRQLCFAAGMNDFLTKPIDREEFAIALHRWTANSQFTV